MHTPPAISYAATVLFNWKKKDAEKQIDCDNFEIVSTFTATADERCFYLVPLRIECLGSAAFNAARTFFATIEPKIDIFAKNYVELCAVFEAALQRATDQLKLMHDGCNPKVFFQKVRGFLKGSWKNPQLPRGVCVGERWFQAPGASASQSPFIHLCDAFVGVAHDDPYSCLIRQILPAEIGDLLAAIECHCVYFRLLIAANPQTKVALGRVADLLMRFRKMHFGLAQRYVLHPSLHAKAAEKESVEFCAESGTGGVEVVAFLEERRFKTAAALNEIHSPN